MARLNEGLSLFDAILIVPMFQIAWTFFSICTGFVYFQEYQVLSLSLSLSLFLIEPSDWKFNLGQFGSILLVLLTGILLGLYCRLQPWNLSL